MRTYFDTKLSMCSFAPSATEEGAEGPKKDLKGPQPSVGASMRGLELLVIYNKILLCNMLYSMVIFLRST